MKKTNRINIFKIRNEFCLSQFSYIIGYSKVFSDKKSSLFIQKDKESIPEWSKFISILYPSYSLKNNSNSFIYLRVHNSSLYALTGGHGHKIINEYIDDEFGLNVALRSIDNLSISSIQQFSIKSQTRHIQRSVANYNPEFDNENYNKILKSISGKGGFLGKSFIIQGKSSIVLRTDKDITEIDSVFDEIDSILLKEEKIKIFRSYKQVKDKNLIKLLDWGLYKKLYKYYLSTDDKNDNLSMLYLDLPDPFKRFDYSKYKLLIEEQEIEIDDLDIDEIKSKICILFNENLSLKQILNIKVTGITNDGMHDDYHRKSLNNLIVCESLLNNKIYIKLDGKWFSILDNIIQFVNAKISNITVEKDYLPNWNETDLENEIQRIKDSENKKSYPEEIYNKMVASQHKFLLLDRSLIQLDSFSKIELADLYDPIKSRFIHVKDVWGAKSSYLFSQALISSILYTNSIEFKNKCDDLFQIPKIGRKTIVIAIAIEKNKIDEFPLNLSYFAKLSLYNTVNNIRNDGYDVILTPILKVK